MTPLSESALVVPVLLAAMVALISLGKRVSRRQHDRDPTLPVGLGATESAVFGLLALLVAFTFSGASQRFAERSQLIVDEATTIRTAWLRLDLLPVPAQQPLRDLLRQYLDARLEATRNVADEAASRAAEGEGQRLQEAFWTQTVAACRALGDGNVTSLVLQPVNEAIAVAAKRARAARTHTPWLIFVVLGGLVLGCSFLAGYSLAHSRHPPWVTWVFPLVMAVTVYLVLDLEFPRRQRG